MKKVRDGSFWHNFATKPSNQSPQQSQFPEAEDLIRVLNKKIKSTHEMSFVHKTMVKLPFFEGIQKFFGQDLLVKLLYRLKLDKFHVGTAILIEGDQFGDRVFTVLQGNVALYQGANAAAAQSDNNSNLPSHPPHVEEALSPIEKLVARPDLHMRFMRNRRVMLKAAFERLIELRKQQAIEAAAAKKLKESTQQQQQSQAQRLHHKFALKHMNISQQTMEESFAFKERNSFMYASDKLEIGDLENLIRLVNQSPGKRGAKKRRNGILRIPGIKLEDFEDVSNTLLKNLEGGSVFGQLTMLPSWQQKYSAIAGDSSEAVVVTYFKRCDFEEILLDYFALELEQEIVFLKTITAFSSLKHLEMQYIHMHIHHLTLIKDAYVYHRGQSSAAIYIIVEGEIEINFMLEDMEDCTLKEQYISLVEARSKNKHAGGLLHSPNRLLRKKFPVAMLGKGQMFGESEILKGCVRASEARVVSLTAKLQVLDSEFVQRILTNPEMCAQMELHLNIQTNQRQKILSNLVSPRKQTTITIAAASGTQRRSATPPVGRDYSRSGSGSSDNSQHSYRQDSRCSSRGSHQSSHSRLSSREQQNTEQLFTTIASGEQKSTGIPTTYADKKLDLDDDRLYRFLRKTTTATTTAAATTTTNARSNSRNTARSSHQQKRFFISKIQIDKKQIKEAQKQQKLFEQFQLQQSHSFAAPSTNQLHSLNQPAETANARTIGSISPDTDRFKFQPIQHKRKLILSVRQERLSKELEDQQQYKFSKKSIVNNSSIIKEKINQKHSSINKQIVTTATTTGTLLNRSEKPLEARKELNAIKQRSQTLTVAMSYKGSQLHEEGDKPQIIHFGSSKIKSIEQQEINSSNRSPNTRYASNDHIKQQQQQNSQFNDKLNYSSDSFVRLSLQSLKPFQQLQQQQQQSTNMNLEQQSQTTRDRNNCSFQKPQLLQMSLIEKVKTEQPHSCQHSAYDVDFQYATVTTGDWNSHSDSKKSQAKQYQQYRMSTTTVDSGSNWTDIRSNSSGYRMKSISTSSNTSSSYRLPSNTYLNSNTIEYQETEDRPGYFSARPHRNRPEYLQQHSGGNNSEYAEDEDVQEGFMKSLNWGGETSPQNIHNFTLKQLKQYQYQQQQQYLLNKPQQRKLKQLSMTTTCVQVQKPFGKIAAADESTTMKVQLNTKFCPSRIRTDEGRVKREYSETKHMQHGYEFHERKKQSYSKALTCLMQTLQSNAVVLQSKLFPPPS